MASRHEQSSEDREEPHIGANEVRKCERAPQHWTVDERRVPRDLIHRVRVLSFKQPPDGVPAVRGVGLAGALVWPIRVISAHDEGIRLGLDRLGAANHRRHGPLLSAGWAGAVEVVQAIALTAVYVAAWLAIRRDRPALPWVGFALLIFSMTTLWPVFCIYAMLNGTPLNSSSLGEGWQDILLHAPAPAWRIGANELDLFLSMSVPPAATGSAPDRRQPSLAVNRINVRRRLVNRHGEPCRRRTTAGEVR
jgi:hypothetical protein